MEGEFELRHTAFTRHQKLRKHVCGDLDESAHYIDAITMETQTPWYELKSNGSAYDTFKLTPYFGYACKDANGPDNYCLDMKIRYCCQKKMMPAWSNWGEWSSCDKSCGGGVEMRTRVCKSPLGEQQNSTQCYGAENPKFKKETRNCNLSKCPKDANWNLWTPWSACAVSCGSATKTRTRQCDPPIHGGKECPDRNEHPDEYIQIEPCIVQDCNVYIPSQWSFWSGCSATCGTGSRKRQRDCLLESDMTVVDKTKCSNNPKFHEQTEECSLQVCPIDGGWTEWGIWSSCSQVCLHHPETGSQVETRAFRSRERTCANPVPNSMGKKCEPHPNLNKGVRPKPRTNGEEERTDCLSELSEVEDKNDVITPWCPEHCIFSEWGQWSTCTFSCVSTDSIKNPILSHTDISDLEFDPSLNYPSTHYYSFGKYTLPRRNRVSTLVKEEQYGGICPLKEKQRDVPGSLNGSVFMQEEDCKLCKEHCLFTKDTNQVQDIRNMPKLEYPGSDQTCVGFCPGIMIKHVHRKKNYIRSKSSIFKENYNHA